MGEGRARLVVDVDIVRVARVANVVVLGLRVVVEIGILVAVVVVMLVVFRDFQGRFWSLLWAWELDGLVPLGSSAV